MAIKRELRLALASGGRAVMDESGLLRVEAPDQGGTCTTMSFSMEELHSIGEEIERAPQGGSEVCLRGLTQGMVAHCSGKGVSLTKGTPGPGSYAYLSRGDVEGILAARLRFST